jgi:hypothetical protein
VSSNALPSFHATLNDPAHIENMSACCDSSNNSVPFVSITLTSANPSSNAFYVNGAEAILNLPALPVSPGIYHLMYDLLGNDPTNGAASSTIGGSNCGSRIIPCFNNGSVLSSGPLIVTSK